MPRAAFEATQSGRDQFSTADIEYRGVKLTAAPGGIVNAFQKNVLTYQQRIRDSITDRFGDLTEGPVFKCFKILDTTLWPNEAGDLQAFGNDEVEHIVNHFAVLLDGKNITKEDILEEFNEFKLFRRPFMLHFEIRSAFGISGISSSKILHTTCEVSFKTGSYI